MTNYRRIPPAIRWGDDLRNRIDFGYNLDAIRAGDRAREGSEWAQGTSGVEDAWITGTDYYLELAARWIPQANTSDPVATGWDGALGWRAFLRWMRDKNPCEFLPDGRNLVLRPRLESDDDVVDDAGPLFTKWGAAWGNCTPAVSFDATVDSGRGAWKIVATNAGGGVAAVDIQQYMPALPGDRFCLSADIQTADLSGPAQAELYVVAYDAAFGSGSLLVDTFNFTPSTLTRCSTPLSSAAPDYTRFALISCRILLPDTGDAGTCWFKNVMVRRASTDTAFVDNPAITSYASDGNIGDADPEDDGTRQVLLKLRNAATAYDGY